MASGSRNRDLSFSRHIHMAPGHWNLSGEVLALSQETGRRLFKVLRARPGDCFTLVDPGRTLFNCQVVSTAPPDRVTLQILSQEPARIQGFPEERILAQALLGHNLEDALRLGAEAGATELWPMETERCAPGAARSLRRERVESMITHSLEVARDSSSCLLGEILQLNQILILCEQRNLLPIALAPQGTCAPNQLSSLLEQSGSRGFALLVGPEGGLTNEEVKSVIESGGASMTLGSRVLPGASAGGLALFALTQLLQQQGSAD